MRVHAGASCEVRTKLNVAINRGICMRPCLPSEYAMNAGAEKKYIFFFLREQDEKK